MRVAGGENFLQVKVSSYCKSGKFHYKNIFVVDGGYEN